MQAIHIKKEAASVLRQPPLFFCIEKQQICNFLKSSGNEGFQFLELPGKVVEQSQKDYPKKFYF